MNDSASLFAGGLGTRFEFLGEEVVSAIEPGTDGSEVAIELGTGFGVRHFAEVAEDNHFPIVSR